LDARDFSDRLLSEINLTAKKIQVDPSSVPQHLAKLRSLVRQIDEKLSASRASCEADAGSISVTSSDIMPKLAKGEQIWLTPEEFAEFEHNLAAVKDENAALSEGIDAESQRVCSQAKILQKRIALLHAERKQQKRANPRLDNELNVLLTRQTSLLNQLVPAN
jgi:hypothetical protein